MPCSKCPLCKERRLNAWAFRLAQHAKAAHSLTFITLTYDTKTVPITNNGYLSLSSRDVQLFLKRLRKRNTDKISYYLAAEYGTKTDRPHYHVILFNAEINTINGAWGLGRIHYGDVNPQTIRYTLKYISKKSSVKASTHDDRQREFARMSKRLGATYLTKAMIKWHKSDLENKMYCAIEDNKKIGMPRYYKDKIYTNDERLVISKKYKAEMRKMLEQLFNNNDYKNIQRDQQQRLNAAFLLYEKESTKNEVL